MGGRVDRRTVLTGAAAIGGVVLAGPGRVRGQGDECTPGHDASDPPCRQVDDDASVLTRFDAAGTVLPVTVEYPCGWRTSTTDQFDDRAQANVTRDDFDAYADVQVRAYYDPVEPDFIESTRETGDYVDVEYDYGGQTRTGIVSSRETADFGTTGHAVVPFGQARIHVEFVSTLKGTECTQPRPDYDLVREMLTSLQPNPESSFAEENPHVDPPASVTIGDQVARDAGTLIRVDAAVLPEGGFVTVHEATRLRDGDAADSILGVSRYFESGTYTDIAVRLDAGVDLPATVIARLYRDTNDNHVFDYKVNQDTDGPYRAGGSPVSDSATVTLNTPTPTPTMSYTPAQDSPTLTATAGSDTTGTPTETARETATDPSSGDGTGFGVLAVVGAMAGTVVAHLVREIRAD